MEEFWTYLGIFIGALGLVVGYWQNRQKVQIERVIRANNWFNFQRANNSNGSLQIAIAKYKERHREDIDAEVLELLSKADAFGQEVYKESIRQIHFLEPSFTRQDIETWEQDGKISAKDKTFFAWLAESSKSKDV